MAEFVYQDRVFRSRTRSTLERLADPTVTGVRVAVAYTSRSGSKSLVELLKRRVGARWSTIDKALVTSFDFYLTEPGGLDIARRNGFEVYRGSSPGFAFHPKLYVFDTAVGGARVLVGSANLTEAALLNNTEFGVALSLSAGGREIRALNDSWDRLVDAAQLIGSADIAQYRSDRARNAPKRRPSPRRPRRARPPRNVGVPRFAEEVVAGRVRPGTLSKFWIEAGGMSSSESHNQLELPRFANHFFGFSFSAHAATPSFHPIGTVRLALGSHVWPAQKFNWRGAKKFNKMERLYLPTVRQGGVDYVDTLILFTRARGGNVRMTVVPASGRMAAQWMRSSANRSRLFSVGPNSQRLCGFL